MQARKAVFWRGLVSLGILAMAPVAFAQSADRAGTWETRIDIVYINSSDWDFAGGTTAEIDSDTSFLLGFGYHLNDNLELGGNFTFGQTDYTADIAGDEPGEFFGVRGEYESTSLLFDATWNFLPGAFSPFVSASAGWAWVDTNIATGPPQTGCWWDPWWGYVCDTFQSTRNVEEFTYQAGVGVRWDLSPGYTMRLAYEKHWLDLGEAASTPSFDQFKAGVVFRY